MNFLQIVLRTTLLLCFVMSTTTVVMADRILVYCEATKKQFVGFVGHKAITAPFRHELGDHFKTFCGDNFWRINWGIIELNKMGARPDQIGLMPMRARHKVAVPGHGLEDAPNNKKTEISATTFNANTPRGVFTFLKASKIASHNGHQDAAVGLAVPISENGDFIGYLLALTVYHTATPIKVGMIIDPKPENSAVLGGTIVGAPGADEVSLAFAVYGTSSIESAKLKVAGRAKPIEFDPKKFKTNDDMVTYIDTELTLNGVNIKKLLEPGSSTLTVAFGSQKIDAIIQQVDEIDLPPTENRDNLFWTSWAALLISLIALVLILAHRLRSHS